MPFLQVLLCLIRSWFLYPGWDVFPYYFWVGPHDPDKTFCYMDTTYFNPKAYTNDLPKCLYILQGLERLDLAPLFYDAKPNPVIQLVHKLREEESK